MESAPPSTRSNRNGQLSSTRLNGWKEIAAHFGKGVRTVQRWEMESRLPVHRIGASRSESVYAFVEELERWRETAEARRAEARAAIDPHQGEDANHAAGRAPRRGGRPILTALAVLGVVAISVATWVAWDIARLGRGRRALDAGPSETRSTQPVSGHVENGVLRIYGDRGQFLWASRFDFRLTDVVYQAPTTSRREPIVIDDIDGDGNMEVLFVSEPGGTTSRGLFCFNYDGSERFRHQPQATVTFGPLTAAPPWRAFFVRVVGEPGRVHNVWFVSGHLSEFPTVVEKLDTHGGVLGQYWSDGQVTEVEEASIGGHRFVFIGATNNEFKGGSLAVLDEQSPTATAPAINPHYRCTGCSTAVPMHFLVFPRLDAAEAAATYSSVVDIRVDDAGQVLLQIVHPVEPYVPPDECLFQSRSTYVLDAGFHIVKAELGDKYEVIHRILEGKGLLTHPFSKARDERSLWPVLRWEGGRFVEVWRPDHAQ
jgi:hypothetical protein